ncbi:hypothetical protein TSH58p_17730 [Azospirillum sp. TSH58]|nr:hypothetical protein [Azospirillum sp. TSH58]AWJ85204.1 hypothetical protein TSH58p_17730 [Azospirillum sp. TSH58]
MVGEPIVQALAVHDDVIHAVEGTRTMLEGLPLDDAPVFIASRGIEFTIFGKNRDGGLAVARVVREPGEPVCTTWLAPSVHLMPAPPAAVKLPAEADVDRLVKLSLAQWKAKAHYANWGCIGGQMTLTTATAAGVAQTVIGTYPDYAELSARFGRVERRHAA